LAEAGRRRVQQFAFEDLWQQALAGLDADWPALQERCQHRLKVDADSDFIARGWQAVGSTTLPDPSLIRALARAVAEQPRSPSLHNTFGVLAALTEGPHPGLSPAVVQKAATSFRRAVEADPAHLVAALNLVETLSVLGRKPEAVERGRRVLAMLDRTG